jgi:CubicO group peptidase (beta-lactamase class C family)
VYGRWIAEPRSLGLQKEDCVMSRLTEHPEVDGALRALDAWIDGFRAYEEIPGISVGVVLDQDLIWSKGYGYSNVAEKRPATTDTLYSICSISKLFTSIGVMQLRDAGELQLRDPVARHLDWFDIKQAHEDSEPITVEGLLTHSSGLPRESDFPYWNGPDFPFPTREQVVERLGAQQTLYPARRLFQYSNLGLSLAGEIIAAKSGQAYQDYVTAQILTPLGLSDTRPYFPEELHGKQLAIGYTGLDRSGTREPVAPFFTRGITPAAGFTSSVNDLAKFASWQFRLLAAGGEEVLQANTLREMHRVHWVDPDWETTWGVGFVVRRVEDQTLVGHGGGCPGYITFFGMVPKHNLAAIVLTNGGDSDVRTLSTNILKTVGAALKKAESPAEEKLPDYSRYEGNYDSKPWGGEAAVRQWGDKLVVIRLPSDDLKDGSTRLQHVSEHTFVRLTDDDEPREEWTFEIGADGAAERIRRHSIYLRRIPAP